MTKTETGSFKMVLEAKLGEVAETLRRRDGITIEKSADELDEVQRAAERELAIRNLDREFSLLRDIRLALGRIRAGNFGVCQDCEDEITRKRLKAVPWAARCIRCQELVDRDGIGEPPASDPPLANAA